MEHIVLIDPALSDNQGTKSKNLGDCVISMATTGILESIFSNKYEIIRVSSHDYCEKKHLAIIDSAKLVFVGGSNLLSSHLLKYNQWKFIPNPNIFSYILAKKRDFILFGTGWWQYQDEMDFPTKRFYNLTLSDNYKHSVRDNYTKVKLGQLSLKKVINTSCPTTWKINGMDIDRKIANKKKVLLTLTDYNTDLSKDSALITTLLNYYDEIIFFQQGSRDLNYFINLEIVKSNSKKFTILPHEFDVFIQFITHNNDFDYIGTRLHGGIKCLENNIQSLIVSVDNRATEISKDINLPVIERGDVSGLENWLNCKSEYGKIKLDTDAIQSWKTQFY